MNIIRIALIAPQEKDRQQLREQMFSYAVRWKVAVVTDCFDCLEEFAMAAQSGGYQLVCLRGGERQWRAAEELRRIRGEGETLWAYLEEGQALRAKVLTAADTFGAVEWRRVSGMNTVMTDYFALAPRHARDAILPIKHPLRTDDIPYIQAQKQTLLLYTALYIISGSYIMLITVAAMLVNTCYGFGKWLLYTRSRRKKQEEAFSPASH